ncbi:glycosyltransferase [Leptolyngbya sp. BC1307]|uniref:glycosyltransferase n=1 Tax=Leptolyngbya sp. BC1307 TaxID=2029589 RepID=UPI00197F3695|nr:glycosyltransferase [Leptolyngbya sp. BC1307]
MATLSLCMIVKDEAANLPRALASVKDLADEIVVIDTGSRDDTPTIAAKAGAKVDFLTWNDDFAQARNAALKQATQDWVLVLDADETLTQAGRQLVGAIKQGQSLGQIDPNDLLLVTLLRQEIGANQSPYSQVSRLFRNLPALSFSRPYHESIDDSAEALMAADSRWQIAQFGDVAIDHTGYRVSEIAAKQKFDRAQRIMEAHLNAHPQDAYMANKLGALYTQNNEWDKSLPILRTALSSGNFDPMTEYELHYHLGITHRHLAPIAGQREAAEAAYRQAIAIPIADKLKLGAYLNLGALLKHKNDLAGALTQYEAAARIDPTQPVTYFNLGVVHRARGYLEPALRAYEYVIALAPDYGAAYQNLAVVLFKLGRLPESKRAFEQAIALAESTHPAESDRLRQGMKKLGLS